MTQTPLHLDAPVPERQRLEQRFIGVRWLGVAAVAVLTTLGGFHFAAIAGAVLALVLGNLAIWHLNKGVSSLTAQRRLGLGAVTLDGLAVLGLAIAAPADAANVTYGALLVVVAETGMRFAPVKAMAGALLLVASLAGVMILRTSVAGDTFDLQVLVVVGVLVLIAGTMIGSVVREIYRQGVASAGAVPPLAGPAYQEAETPPAMQEEAMALLTPRERQVMTLIGQGYSNAQIAAALVVEQKTVKNHINNIYGKLRLNSRYEAITHTLGHRRTAPVED